jgi:hydroxymethylpyrimidine pyrophosphatase-like HAD family hydrolase
MKISIDFDGVLVERNEIPRTTDIMDCPPTKNAREALEYLLSKGHKLYISTARPQSQWLLVKKWLEYNGFPKIKITNKKEPNTTLYIDDRAYRFTNWLDITKLCE